jgi:hypothetical protein
MSNCSWQKKVLLLAWLALQASANAAECRLPVCDIPSEIQMLEKKNQAFRFQYIQKMRADFSKEKNEENLDNILEFSKRFIELNQRMNDEDYVLREAKGLRDQTLFLSIQWVWRDCRKLTEGYAQLGSETQRYAAIDFFVRRAESTTQRDEISQLVCFSHAAGEKSRTANDADYLVRHTLLLASLLSTQLLEVTAGWEGVFKISNIDGPLQDETTQLKLILFSTGGEAGIVASLSHPIIRPNAYQKVSFRGTPDVLSSPQSFASQTPSTIELRFNGDYSQLDGSFLEPRALRKTSFQAVREVSVPNSTPTPCKEDDILGEYEVAVAGLKGIFAIQNTASKQLAGAFESSAGELRLPFSYGKYNPATGRLTFLNSQANVPLGWRLLAESTSESGCVLSGWGLSTLNGVSYPLHMKKTLQTSD